MATARLFGLALFLLACMTGAGYAQTWPSRPVRVIVPITTGSAIDIVARATSQQLAKEFGQPFVVENRPGAGTTIGAAAVASAVADGYTLLFASTALTTTPSTIASLSYDVARDLVAVAPITNTPMILVTPREIVDRLYREARRISEAAEFRKAMFAIGGEPLEPMTSEQFNTYVKAELVRNAAIAKAVGLVPQ